MTCLILGAKPSQCSALYVINANAHTFPEVKKPEVVRSIKYDSYANDFLSSRATDQEATDLARDVTEINAKGNFIMKIFRRLRATTVRRKRRSVTEGESELWGYPGTFAMIH